MSRGLTNVYVSNLCRRLSDTNFFIGVYSCDKLLQKRFLKKVVSKPVWSIVVNLSPSNHSGSHFIVIVYIKKLFLYFDSLKLEFSDPNIQNFVNIFQAIKKRHVVIKQTTKQIQPFSSDFCGFYSAAFIQFIYINQKFVKNELSNLKLHTLLQDFFKHFNVPPTPSNDQKVIQMICSRIKS